MHHEAGKGDAPRKTKNDVAYSEGWERIFGSKRKEHLKEKSNDDDTNGGVSRPTSRKESNL